MWFCLLRRTFSTKVCKSAKEAVKDIPSGSSIAVGGFGNCGVPQSLIDAVSELGINDLSLFTNNCGVEGYGLNILLQRKQVKRVTASFVGQNELFEKAYLSGELEVDIIPQGNLAERMRAGGAGIPAFYTATGFGTIASEGNFPIKFKQGGKLPEILSSPKETREINGRHYVLESAIQTDYSFVKAWKGDTLGNLVYRNTAQNFNPMAAMAGKMTIAEVEELVEPGEIDPNTVHTPGVYVQKIIHWENRNKPIEKRPPSPEEIQAAYKSKGEANIIRERIIKRTAKELTDGMSVNLGIGMPSMVIKHIPRDMKVYFQCENGILGMGPYPRPGEEDPDLISANKEAISVVKGGSFFGSSDSFAMIRGGNLQLSILGGLQVSKQGDLANWIIPGKMVKGMGGAMDLVSSNTKCIVMMEHTAKNAPRILEACTLPLTGKNVVSLLITELGVFDFKREGGITLVEITKGVELEHIQRSTGCRFLVASDLREMKVD